MQIIKDSDVIEFIGSQEKQWIARASEFSSDVLDRLANGNKVTGDRLPWSKTHDYVGLRPGEVSIWSGINAHGKSILLSQVCAWALNKKWVIASMEMQPAATMARMVRQILGTHSPDRSQVVDLMRWTDGKLWIYDQQDSVEAERILGMIHGVGSKETTGVLDVHADHVVIDSLMKCGIRPDDYNAQKEFVDRLCWIAKTLNIHIHLVHHIRKGDREGVTPNKFDIKGAGEITDLVDNVFIVHRNKDKEKKLDLFENKARFETLTLDDDEEIKRLRKQPDCSLLVEKQRHYEWEGRFNLWFDKATFQYRGDQSYAVMNHVFIN